MAAADRRDRIVDAVLGVVAAAAVIAITRQIEPTGSERELDALAYVAMAAAGLALAVRRRYPRAILAVITVALIVFTRRLYLGGPIYLTMAVALYTLSVQARTRREAVVPAATAVAAMTLGGIVGVGGSIEWTWHAAVFPGWAAAALFLGEAARNRRDYLQGLVDRARYLEETREEEARRRVAEERLRIARDLHDVVAHTIATINLQSGVAAHVLERRPEQAAEALVAIKRSSGDALHELRATLDVLRSDGDTDDTRGTDASGGTAPRSPTPGLARVEDLAATAAGAGLPVTVQWEGERGPLPVAVDVAGYRIVQESITNVMRHAQATRATVVIRCTPGAVDVEVTDDGRGAAATSAGTAGSTTNHAGSSEGHGIAGMRERATLVGGTLQAGPNPGGGYRVRAHLPTGEQQ